MRARSCFACVVAVLLVVPFSVGAAPGDWAAGINLGSEAGPGFQVHGTVRDFTPAAPLSARFILGYNKAGAGDPVAARHVFINDNTNGTPTDNAVDQPTTEIMAMVGLQFSL